MNDTYPIPEFLRLQPEQPTGPRENPILFSPPMVRALLSGTKTQTRRVVKPQPAEFYRATRKHQRILVPSCPYGQPGDRLYVKEKHAFLDVTKSNLSQFPLVGGWFGPDVWNLCVEYCDGTENDAFSVEGERPKQTRARGDDGWRPSIHMPRWASRILLEITAVRVERLRDISENDAEAEGCTADPADGPTFRDEYRKLWESINGAGSWAANPLVWVVEFRRISP